MASISQGFIKVCRKLNRNIATVNFIKHYQPGINPSVLLAVANIYAVNQLLNLTLMEDNLL